MAFLPALTRIFLDLLFPIQCAGCADEGSFLCRHCSETLILVPPACIVCKKLVPARDNAIPGRTCKLCRKKSHISSFFSPFLYETGLIRDLIHQLKYRRIREIHIPLAKLLASSLRYFLVPIPPGAIIVPIPLAPARRRVRGFNQSALIAERLWAELGLPLAATVLKKIKNTPPQMELARDARLGNLAGAFAVSDAAAIKNKIVILIDDVKTTGATLEEAAKTLKAAGAKEIRAITIAR